VRNIGKILTNTINDKTTRKSMNITSILAISFLIGVVLATNASAVMTDWTLDITANSTDTAGNLLESKVNFGVNIAASDNYDGAPFDIDAAPISPTGFDLRFIEPDVSTGELSNDTKAVGESKSWILQAQAPKARKINIKWFSAEIPANVELQMQEIDLNTGSPIGSPVDMKSINLIEYKAGVFSNLQKGYMITATAIPIEISGSPNAGGTDLSNATASDKNDIPISGIDISGILKALNDFIFETVSNII